MINNKLELKYKSYERGKCPCCQSINYRELFNSKIKKSDLNLLKKIYNNNIDKIRFGNNELISLVKCKSCDLITEIKKNINDFPKDKLSRFWFWMGGFFNSRERTKFKYFWY